MAILKFRVHYEEDDSVYRDIAIRHNHTFFQLHDAILKAFEFDNKHGATFFRSNDRWQRGREISLEIYDNRRYQMPPLLMKDVTIGSEIKDPNQKFIYVYDFNKNWNFQVSLIGVSKEENPKMTYPSTVRTEGIAPSQYGAKSLLGERFADVEEKYDLSKDAEGFGTEGEGGATDSGADEGGHDEGGNEEF
ncbi:IS1096 element passenger TnpR family protein [Flaviaesturariibacter amylovorans]|uniref:Plasmid pRiA4b Orf3-like domain-containing protein n=1 Tax=Flaviaesturariibacter amylovorans TaxID=1084520 RepID=A0ABP8GF21_9BACT